MRTVEVYINSYIDRLVNQNDSATKEFTVLFSDIGSQMRFLNGETKCRVKLFSLEVPNSAYNFTEIESRLWFVYDVGNTDVIVSIIIDTERVYPSAIDLVNEINTKFTAHAQLSDLSISFDNNTKKMTLTNGSAVNIRLISGFRYGTTENILTFNDMNDRCGFSQELTNTVISPAGTLIGKDGLKIYRTNKYYVSLQESGGYFRQSIVPSSNKNFRLIGSVVGGSYGSLSSNTFISPFGYEISAMSGITQLTFQLLDDNFIPIDLGANIGLTMSIHIEFE